MNEVFKISLRISKKNLWSGKVDSSGYIVRYNNGLIIGYTDETKTKWGERRYICGYYNKHNNQMIFYKMYPNMDLIPLAYSFDDINREGMWSAFYLNAKQFFYNGAKQGCSKIVLEKIKDMPEEVVERKFNVIHECNCSINEDLIAHMEKHVNSKKRGVFTDFIEPKLSAENQE